MRDRVNTQLSPGENGEPPLVLVQGFPSDRETWSKQVQAYKASRHLVECHPDEAGALESPLVMKHFAEDLSELLIHQDDAFHAPSMNLESDDDAIEEQHG